MADHYAVGQVSGDGQTLFICNCGEQYIPIDGNACHILQTEIEVAQSEVVEEYIRELPWDEDDTDRDKNLVAGNIRGFAHWYRKHLGL